MNHHSNTISSLMLVLSCSCLSLSTNILNATERFVSFKSEDGNKVLVSKASSLPSIYCDATEYRGVIRAINNLQQDLASVTDRTLQIKNSDAADCRIVIGSIDSSAYIKQLIRKGEIDIKELKGKTEKYIIKVKEDGTVIIAGSDKRGTIYGVYEFSRQAGVSPWAWWADMPVTHQDEIYVSQGSYTDGEPTVRYRGIFLNDEAPCLSGWVKEKFPDSQCPTADPKLARGFNHNFYEKVFELLLRLRANYLWPAMWGNAFYADDPMNSVLANEMGIMMGTSHHEPMARNHQEWARHRKENGEWDYVTNQAVIDNFFREGVRRAKNNEDLITIGMRGDGDAAMGGKEGHDQDFVSQDDYYIKLYEKIFKNQRQIIKEETGKPAEKRQQIWALYKEVQRYYELGLTVPDDVLILLCDDNWGNIRRVPQKPHKGGFGMYYHVDYVGAPRCTKWANVTPISHLWEQMQLCYQYGIDRLWILNVGDLKPMEYPIQFFLDMAWRPEDYMKPESYIENARKFTAGMVGNDPILTESTARLLEKYTTLNGRVTPEMLSARTYNLESGEWQQVVNEYKALETDALRTYLTLPQESRDTYFQLLLYPIQSMANLYEMYYAQARNRQAFAAGDPSCDRWADEVERCFKRDKDLTDQYHALNGGKWNHLMDEVHIGYTSWNGPKQNIMPKVMRMDNASDAKKGGFSFKSYNNYVSMEAEHYYEAKGNDNAEWITMPNYGRTLSAIALWPYNASTVNASVTYRFQLPSSADPTKVKVHVITNSTLPFLRKEGHRYTLSLDGQQAVEVNYNSRYTEDNQWEMYDIVATRVIETKTDMATQASNDGMHTLTITPIEPGLVIEKIVIDLGGYQRQHLFGNESPLCEKKK